MKQGWEIKKLGEVVDIINGRNQSQVISDNGEYPIYGSAGNLMGYATDYLCEKGTTIIGRKGNISNPIFIEERFWNVDTAFGLFPKNGYDPKFINYLCQTIDFKSRNRGTTIPSLVKSDLLTIDVPFISSLPEQQRIVSILDECFADIDKAKANAEQNLKNARELFESYLQGMFEKKGNDWEEKKLGEVYDVRDGTHDSPKYINEGYPLVTSKNLKNHKLILDDVKFISETDYVNINKRSKVDIGDVLFAMIGTIGNPVVIDDEPNYAIKNVALFKVGNNQSSYFLKYFLDSKQTIDKMMQDAKGTTQKFVGLGYLRSFPILIPPLKEQQTVVRQLDALRAETQKLEAVYQKKIADLEELKKSILQKAFAGELKTEKAVLM